MKDKQITTLKEVRSAIGLGGVVTLPMSLRRLGRDLRGNGSFSGAVNCVMLQHAATRIETLEKEVETLKKQIERKVDHEPGS